MKQNMHVSVSHYLHRLPFFQVQGWCISNVEAGHQRYGGMNSRSSLPLCPRSLLHSLPLAGAVCSAVRLSDRIYPRWVAQLTPLICVSVCMCLSVCVCVYTGVSIQGILSLPPWWPFKDTLFTPKHTHIIQETHNTCQPDIKRRSFKA